MIWGSQYDAMMNWMVKMGKKVGIVDDEKRNLETITGKKENDILNNVYDLYGCHYEWTMEASRTSFKAFRGGANGMSYSPSSRRNDYPNESVNYHSSRATLYIK